MARPFAQALGRPFTFHRADRAKPVRRVHTATAVAGLRFALPHSAAADVHVVDASGNRVRTIACGELAAGEHACGWDGLDDAGTRCPAGSYVLRLETSGDLLTSRIVSLT
jgi:flagellar hook assembly protein FlgD